MDQNWQELKNEREKGFCQFKSISVKWLIRTDKSEYGRKAEYDNLSLRIKFKRDQLHYNENGIAKWKVVSLLKKVFPVSPEKKTRMSCFKRCHERQPQDTISNGRRNLQNNVTARILNNSFWQRTNAIINSIR